VAWLDRGWQIGAGLVLGASLVVPASRLPSCLVCPFRYRSGFPCPGCGLTHAFCDITHGHLAAAWQANPFGFLFYLAALACFAWPQIRVCFPGILAWRRRTRLLLWGPAVLVTLMWLIDVARIARIWRAH
jgi:hypothetical protein